MEFRADVFLGMHEPLYPPLMNGGGCCKTVEDVELMSRSTAGAILYGSITKDQRDGNPGDTLWVDKYSADKYAALNSIGLLNPGSPYLKSRGREMVAIAHDAGKKFVVSVAGFNSQEYAFLTETALEQGADAVELNLGCGNIVRGDNIRKPIPAYNIHLMGNIIARVQKAVGDDVVVWIKLSYYPPSEQLQAAANVMRPCRMIKAVTTINTLAGGYGLDAKGRPVITVGLAGVSGFPLKHVGLGQILQLRRALPERIALIAVGGIARGIDIHDYSRVGADGFQMTTELLRTGRLDPQPLERIAMEYGDIEEIIG